MKIIFATDRNFFPGFKLAFASLLSSKDEAQNLSFHILHSELSAKHISSALEIGKKHGIGCNKISFINIDSHDFTGVRQIRGSKMAYARMLIPELFLDDDEAIYCDCDILFNRGIGEFINIPMSTFLIAGVQDSTVMYLKNDCAWPDVNELFLNEPYFNSGLMRMNLKLWREHNIGPRALHIARNEPEKCKHWDQSILNYLCAGKVNYLAISNNLQIREEHEMPDDPALNIHYIGAKKPWIIFSRRRSFSIWRKSYRDNVSKIPHYQFHLSYWFRSFVRKIGMAAGVMGIVRRGRRALCGW